MDRPNSINVALIGEVSVGKTTVLNTMFIKKLSDTKRIRTTKSVNIYCEVDDPTKVQDTSTIYKLNTCYEEAMKGKQITTMKENIYTISPSKLFGDSLSGYNLNIIDIPGLNDGADNEIIKKWISDNFINFDVVFFIVNGEYALNTETERKLLQFVIDNCNKYPHIKLFALINKYDDPDDDELRELKEQAVKVINDMNKTKLDIEIIELCARQAYLYRYLEYNKTLEGLDQRSKSLLAVRELGTKAKQYDDKKLLEELLLSIGQTKEIKDSCYNNTNFNKLINTFKEKVGKEVDNIYYNKNMTQIRENYKNWIFEKILSKYQSIAKFKRDDQPDKLLEQVILDHINSLYKFNDRSLNHWNYLIMEYEDVFVTYIVCTPIDGANNKLYEYLLNHAPKFDELKDKNYLAIWVNYALNNDLLTYQAIHDKLLSFYSQQRYMQGITKINEYCKHIITLIECDDEENDIDYTNLIDSFLHYICTGILENKIVFDQLFSNSYSDNLLYILITEFNNSYPCLRSIFPKFYLIRYEINGSPAIKISNLNNIDKVSDLWINYFPELLTFYKYAIEKLVIVNT